MIPEPEIPITQLTIEPHLLSPDALKHLAREFILREMGQENSATDVDSEIGIVISRIQKGEFQITFDSETESVGIKPRG